MITSTAMKRNIILLICACIAFSGPGSQRALAMINCDTVTDLIVNQPLMQYYFSFSDIPVKIVTTLFFKANGIPMQEKQGSKNGRQNGRGNTASDYSLTGAAKCGSKWLSRAADDGIGTTLDNAPPSYIGQRFDMRCAAMISCWGGGFAGLMLLLMLFVLLPRGGLDESIRRTENIYIG